MDVGVFGEMVLNRERKKKFVHVIMCVSERIPYSFFLPFEARIYFTVMDARRNKICLQS